jgi:hypothetical protein
MSKVWIDKLQQALASNNGGTPTSSDTRGWTTVTAVNGTIPGFLLVTRVVTLDAGLYKDFQFILTGLASVTGFLAPTNSIGTSAAGSTFDLYLDMDATGGRDIPVFQGGTGGFASDTQAQIQAAAIGTASTRTRCSFKYDGTVWFLAHTPYSGGATS